MPDRLEVMRPGAVLDHVAVATGTLTDGWELFSGLLGGAWAYGGDSPGFWWGQLSFCAGPKVELLTPTGGPDAGFLERFLAGRGPGVHHLNFIVPAIDVSLGKLNALGIEPVQVRLQNPRWKEAFLHPGDAHGTVIQIAEQAGPPSSSSPPAALGSPGPSCSFSLIELRVADIESAIRLFQQALDGEVTSRHDTATGPVAELSWPNQARLRLVQSATDRGASPRSGDGVTYLQFSRDDATFSSADMKNAAALSRRLGLSIQLSAAETHSGHEIC